MVWSSTLLNHVRYFNQRNWYGQLGNFKKKNQKKNLSVPPNIYIRRTYWHINP